MKVLVTGGLGYIGSHTVVELINARHDVVILDDLSNSFESALDSIVTLTSVKPAFYQGSIKHSLILHTIFEQESIEAVLHFAAFKSVNESVLEPLKYLDNNVAGTITLLAVMKKFNVSTFIFSSSATVYGDHNTPPFHEELPLDYNHAYGQSKVLVEQILASLKTELNYVSLRYFNPVGAHPSGILQERSKTAPTNLMPIINEVASGKRKAVHIYGSDYPTPDGTAIRDFIHVVDVARAHVSALAYIIESSNSIIVNIGTGHGYSVKEIIEAYEKENGVSIPTVLSPRRKGDIPASYADVHKSQKTLGFTTKFNLKDMVIDSYKSR